MSLVNHTPSLDRARFINGANANALSPIRSQQYPRDWKNEIGWICRATKYVTIALTNTTEKVKTSIAIAGMTTF
jgi:hypothetical protein